MRRVSVWNTGWKPYCEGLEALRWLSVDRALFHDGTDCTLMLDQVLLSGAGLMPDGKGVVPVPISQPPGGIVKASFVLV